MEHKARHSSAAPCPAQNLQPCHAESAANQQCTWLMCGWRNKLWTTHITRHSTWRLGAALHALLARTSVIRLSHTCMMTACTVAHAPFAMPSHANLYRICSQAVACVLCLRVEARQNKCKAYQAMVAHAKKQVVKDKPRSRMRLLVVPTGRQGPEATCSTGTASSRVHPLMHPLMQLHPHPAGCLSPGPT